MARCMMMFGPLGRCHPNLGLFWNQISVVPYWAWGNLAVARTGRSG
ncbi:hypothetical protein ACFL39_00180 [Gemmatimonadota bacterium]